MRMLLKVKGVISLPILLLTVKDVTALLIDFRTENKWKKCNRTTGSHNSLRCMSEYFRKFPTFLEALRYKRMKAEREP